MNRLSLDKRTEIVNLLCEGMSLRAASRLADVSINTVTKLLIDVGKACRKYHDEHVQGITTKRVQCDEIWSFVYAKEKNVPDGKKGKGVGDVWTWVAIDADTKLAISWLVGDRDAWCALRFMKDVASRIKGRFQLTTDGLNWYREAVDRAFPDGVDFAQLVKQYGQPQGEDERRYSPAVCAGAHKTTISGDPDWAFVSTSHVERQNLTMRMNMRRFTRLTNAFSKKIQNHAHAVAIHFMYYNFVRIHKTLGCTPAMEASLSKTLWTIEDLVRLTD